MSKRSIQWDVFAELVHQHIEDYTVPQYGDAPNEQVKDFIPRDIRHQLSRYVNRINSNIRGMDEAKRDCLKIAHYACYIYEKLSREA